MLKAQNSVKVVDRRAVDALRQLLEQIPTIILLDIGLEAHAHEHGADLVACIEASGTRYTLICDVESSGQPRHVRMGLLQLRHQVVQQSSETVPILIAPYLSAEAQAMCREQSVGFLDLEGNARLLFDSVFIERQVASKPVVERRELRSLFKAKSAQVLRVLLRDPARSWRVTELAEASGVSLGHVSNLRKALLDREWAKVSSDGVFLSQPDALLDEWRVAYEAPHGDVMGFYTTLHGNALEDAARDVFRMSRDSGKVAFASFSAGSWLAPYGRTGMHYFYTNWVGLEHLRTVLKLTSTAKGENVSVTVLKDVDLFRDMVEPAPDVICTSAVQTYLDLATSGERGSEAAEHLRQKVLTWSR
jgi:hypothetical protein